MRNGYSISWHNYKYSFESMPNLFLSSKRQLVVFLRFHDHFVHRFYSNRMYLHLRLWYCLVTACYCYFIPVKSISDLCVLFFYFGFFFDSLSILCVCFAIASNKTHWNIEHKHSHKVVRRTTSRMWNQFYVVGSAFFFLSMFLLVFALIFFSRFPSLFTIILRLSSEFFVNNIISHSILYSIFLFLWIS